MEVSSGTTQAVGHSTTNILVHPNILPSKYSSKYFSIHIISVLLVNLSSNECEGKDCHEEKNTIYKKVKVQMTHDKKKPNIKNNQERDVKCKIATFQNESESERDTMHKRSSSANHRLLETLPSLEPD